VAYKAGDVVRHQQQTEWGVGKVVSLTGDGKVVVKFSGRPGDVMLSAAGAGTHLALDDSEWQDAPRAKGRKAKSAVIKKMPCITCSKDLKQSFAYAHAGWKACPECSAKNGRQHVLRPSPQAFETPDANGNVARGDSAQAGWCLSCRSNGAIELGEPKLCSDFTR
jgi:hypothetical protein